MLFRDEIWAGIASGVISVAFRRLEQGDVREGQTFATPLGVLTIGLVKPIDAETIREADAHRAGYASRAALLTELAQAGTGQVFRIEIAFRSTR